MPLDGFIAKPIIILLTVTIFLEHTSMVKEMVLVFTHGKMVKNMLANLKMIYVMAKELIIMQVGIFMKAYGLIINKMVQEHIFLVVILNGLAINMSADIRMVLDMVKERILIKMVKN